MSNLNLVAVQGNLGRDPEVKFTQNGKAVCNMSIAVSDSYYDKETKQTTKRTDWIRIVVWGRQAETCGDNLRKGQEITIKGRLRQRSWEDKNGEKRYELEVYADQVIFGPKPRGQQSQGDGEYQSGRQGNGYSPARNDQKLVPPGLHDGARTHSTADDSDVPF